MPKLWLSFLFAFMIALLGWAAFGVSEMQDRIAIAAIVGVVLTAITSVLTIVVNNKEYRERELNLLIHKEQQKVFEHFYAAFFESLKGVKKGDNGQPSKTAVDEMYEFKRGLMNWGSERLIADYLRYEQDMESAATSGTADMLNVGDRFLKSMRRELGFEDNDTVNIMSVILDSDARKQLIQ